MRDVVDSVPVKANRFHKIDLYFVCSGDSANQVFSSHVHGLGDCNDRRNVVPGMRIVRGEKCVMHIKFAYGGNIPPRRPFPTKTLPLGYAKYGCPTITRKCQRPWPSRNA